MTRCFRRCNEQRYACMEESIRADGNHSCCHPYCVLNTWQSTAKSNVIIINIQNRIRNTKYNVNTFAILSSLITPYKGAKSTRLRTHSPVYKVYSPTHIPVCHVELHTYEVHSLSNTVSTSRERLCMRCDMHHARCAEISHIDLACARVRRVGRATFCTSGVEDMSLLLLLLLLLLLSIQSHC